MEPELHRAARSGNARRVADLLAAGADPGARWPEGAGGAAAYAAAEGAGVREAFQRAAAEQPVRCGLG